MSATIVANARVCAVLENFGYLINYIFGWLGARDDNESAGDQLHPVTTNDI